MQDFFEELNKLSKSLRLEETKKAEFRNELMRYMNMHPVKHREQKNVFIKTFSYFKIHRTALVPVLACAVLVLGTGTSYAAADTLPGDFLYAIKVHVNEEVKAALILDEDKKADFEITRAEARLAEADNLAAQGRLNAEIQAQVETKLKNHSEKVERRIKKLEDSGDTEKAASLAAHFEASLQAHTNILSAIEKESTSEFRKNVGVRTDDAVKQREGLNAKITSESNQDRLKASAEGKINAAQNTVAEVKKYIERKSQDNRNSTQAATQQLKSAENILVEAKAKLEAGQYKTSFELAGKAQREALQAKALVKVETRLPERVRQDLPRTFQSSQQDDDRRGDSGGSREEEESRNTIENLIPKINF